MIKQLRQRGACKIETVVAGPRYKVNVAVNTLGYSRRFHAWAAPSQDTEHTYEALVQAFRYFGGVPRTVLVDNQKAAVLKHDHSTTLNIKGESYRLKDKRRAGLVATPTTKENGTTNEPDAVPIKEH